MAVLVEAISVIVRRDAITRSFAGGWRAFYLAVPNNTFCADDEVVRVGFLAPEAVGQFLDALQAGGLTWMVDGKCADIAVVDQQRGPMAPCDWLEFAKLPFGKDGGRVSACWLFDEPRVGAGIHMRGARLDLQTPPGWVFEGSMSQKFTFIPLAEVNQ